MVEVILTSLGSTILYGQHESDSCFLDLHGVDVKLFQSNEGTELSQVCL